MRAVFLFVTSFSRIGLFMIYLYCDEPSDKRVDDYSLFLEVAGWAISEKKIRAIRLFINEEFIGNAVYGLERPDVEKVYPNIVDSLLSGFWFEIDLRCYNSGTYVLKIEVSDTKEQKEIIKKVFIKKPHKPIAEPNQCYWCNSDNIAERFGWHKNKFQLFHCSKCSTGFIWPIPDKKELEQYYSNQYWGHAEEIIKENPIHYDTAYIYKIIKNFSPESKSVCEIGCGPGTLLNGLKKMGYEVYGQEYSKKVSELGRKHFNLNITTGPLSELRANKFDCVIIRHMIEHSPQPVQDFIHAAEQVKNDRGILILVTPNYHSLAAQLFKRFWEWFVPPAHLFYFSIDSFKHITKKISLSIAMVETRQGDAIQIMKAWSNYTKYNEFINDEWSREWMNNGEIFLNDIYKAYGNSVLNNLGLGEELVIIFKQN